MSLFGDLKTEGHEQTEDRLGGFSPLDTDMYEATIKVAYAGKSDGGARNITIVATLTGGKEYSETIYVTNKNGENFFLNPQDKDKKVSLPGFTVINDMCLMTTEKPLSEQASEEKVVNIYDYDAKKELPKSVPVLIDLLGKQIYLGIVKQTENKNVKDGNGVYVPTDDTIEKNVIEKVFHFPSKMTVVEARDKKDPAFADAWVERNKGNTRDKRKNKGTAAGNSGRTGSAPTAGSSSTGRPSLFGN